MSAQTTVRPPPADGRDARLAVLRDMRDREAIRDLALLYARAVDGYDVDAVTDLFTADGAFERRGGPAAGQEELRAAYAASMQSNRTVVHALDGHVVQPLPGRRGIGWAAGHAELAMDSTVVLAAFRYDDEYRCVDDGGLFARRSLIFQYAVPADQMPRDLGQVERVRWPRARVAADYPENLHAWQGFQA